MATSNRPPPSALASKPAPELTRLLLWSAAAHVVLLGVVLGLSAWNSTTHLDLDQKPIHATLVRRGQARDAKLLPRIEEPPPPPPPPKVETPVPSVRPSPPAPPATRAEPSKAADDSAGRRSRLFDAFKKTAKSAEPLEGAPDGDPEGDSATAEGEQYYGLVSRDVHRYYDVSHTIPEQERLRLNADVLVKIGPGGALDLVKLVNSSKNDLFDNAVLAAVKKAAPFPAPPAHLRDVLRTTGVVLRFKPQ